MHGSKSRRPGGASSNASADVREILHEGAIQQLAGIEDEGSFHTAKVVHPDGDSAVIVDDDKREVRVWVEDVITGHPVLATLYAPGNALWRKPPASNVVSVLRGANTGGPSAATALHGDGGNDNDVPSALTDTNTVLSPPTGDLLLESRDGDAILRILDASKHVLLGASDADQALVKGDAYRTAEHTFNQALQTFFTAQATGWTAMATAWTALGVAVPATAALTLTASTAATAAAAAATTAATAAGTMESSPSTYLSTTTKVK